MRGRSRKKGCDNNDGQNISIGQRAFRIARSAIRSAWSQVISWPQAFAVVKIAGDDFFPRSAHVEAQVPLESSRPVAKALSIA